MSTTRRITIMLALALVTPAVSHAGWLVYVGGGVQRTQGDWSVRGGQVVFHAPNGTLLAVRVEDVDVPASSFLSFQLQEGRRHTEASPLGARRESTWKGLAGFVPAGTPCTAAKVSRVLSAETLEVVVGDHTETVHAACLAAPQNQQRFSELAWFGRESASAVANLLRAGQTVCLADEQPAQRDPQGHRRLYIELPDGRDLTAEVIGRGLGVLRNGTCSRAARYQVLAQEAFTEQRGHWGAASLEASLAVLANGPIMGAGPPLVTAAGAG